MQMKETLVGWHHLGFPIWVQNWIFGELILILYFPRTSGFCFKIKVKNFIVEKITNMSLSKEDTVNILMLAAIFFYNTMAIF